METKKLIEYITNWNPFCEHITLSTIFAKMKFSKGTNHVINHGPPGTGKSRSTLELLEQLDSGTEIILDNTTTDKGLFETFMNYPEQDIVLDECSTLLKSLKTQDMVKLAMEGKPLTWTKDGSSEKTPPYEGNLIVNANVPISDTVVDRCVMNKAVMNKEMTLSFNDLFMQAKLNKPDFKPFFTYITSVIKSKKETELTKEEMKYVFDFTQEKISDVEKEGDYSRRIIIRELSYFKHVKMLFGSLNKEVLDFVKPFAEAYIINAQTPNLIDSILGDNEMDKPSLVKRMSREGDYTEQHARRLITRGLEEGKLILKGKMVRLKK